MKKNKQKKLTLISLVLMIFTSVFGFINIPKAFFLMGYSSIIWYILAAITFFIPFAFMLAEYGAAFKNHDGGMFTWMAKSVNPKFAFITTFMWYASYIIWMVNVSSGIWITFSNAIFGVDTTQKWNIFGFGSTQLLGILAIILIIIITFFSSLGMKGIKKITSIGGIAVALTNVLLFIGGMIVIFSTKKMAQPLNIHEFLTSPNPEYASLIQVFGFLVFAIFAFGGLEVIGGLVDQTKNAEKTFPKAIIISSAIIAIGYALGIFMMGSFTNWNFVTKYFTTEQITMGNISYIIMNNMGYQIGLALHFSNNSSIIIGQWVSRYIAFSMVIAITGSFFTLIFAPLKQLISGTPKKIWPKFLTKTKNELPVNAMFVQAIIVIILILVVSFGGKGAKQFFDILVSMTNVSMTIPYVFLAFAFIGFKNNKSIEKPFEIFKSKKITYFVVIVVIFVVSFANIFTIIQPALNNNVWDSIYAILGPLIFSIIAYIMYSHYEKNNK